MHPIRTRARRLATVTLATGLCAVLTSCASGGPAAPTGTPTAGPGATTAPAAAALHGLIAVLRSATTSDTGASLGVFDPKTGHLTQSVPIGWDVAPDVAFTPDWSLVAAGTSDWSADQSLILARRTGDTYVRVGTWNPPNSLSQGPQKYANPVFNRVDGRLWFARRALTQSVPDDSDAWFSVDPTQPTAAPRPEQHRPPVTDPDGHVVQARQVKVAVKNADSGTVATVTTSDTGPLSATVEGSVPASGFANGLMWYHCNQRISPQELLCFGDGGQDGAGAAIALTVPASGGKATLRQIFPPASGGSQITGAYLSPDGKSVLLGTGSGWFVGPITGSKDPTPAFNDLDQSTLIILGWY